MKNVTYNLNGIRARLPRLIEYLDERKPDALCLQEIKCDDDSFPIGDIRAAGYDGVWHGQKGFNGVAILTPAGAAPFTSPWTWFRVHEHRRIRTIAALFTNPETSSG